VPPLKTFFLLLLFLTSAAAANPVAIVVNPDVPVES